MNKFSKIIGYSCLGILFLFSSCIKEDMDKCISPNGSGNSYIRFVYDYNMAFEDLFSKQAGKIDVFFFDENGTFLYRLKDEYSSGSTFPKGYTMKIPEEAKNATQFVAWSGLYTEALTVTEMTSGLSQISDLKVALKPYSNNVFNSKIKPLWHGIQTRTLNANGQNKNDTTTISLVKNTNIIRIIIQSVEEDLTLDIKDFSFTIDAINGAYNYQNNVYSTAHWFYQPYQKYNEDETCGVVEMNTLRLLADRKNQLLVEQVSVNEPLLDIDLNKIINTMKVQDYSGMPLQEYMDREDEFKITIFVKKTAGNPNGPWIVVEVQINPWVERDQELEFHE